MSPQGFLKCVREDGRVRTKSLPENKYIRICFKDGKSYSGEVETRKSAKSFIKHEMEK